MSAVEDLTELVERAGAAERAALASKWKERSDVEALRRHVAGAVREERRLERLSRVPELCDRRARLRGAFLDGGLDGPGQEGRETPDLGDDPRPAASHTGPREPRSTLQWP